MSTKNNDTPAQQWQKITPEQYAHPETLPASGWYFIPAGAGGVQDKDEWVHRKRPFPINAVVVATYYHPDQPTAPTAQPEHPAATGTPRTNAASYNGYGYLFNESKQLERDLNEARAEVERLRARRPTAEMVEGATPGHELNEERKLHAKEMDIARAQLRDLTDQLAARDGVIARLKEAGQNLLKEYTGAPADSFHAELSDLMAHLGSALATTPATYADKLREAETELARITPDYNVYAKIQDDNVSLRAELTALRGLLEKAVNQMEGVAKAHNVAWDYEINAIRARLATERKEDV